MKKVFQVEWKKGTSQYDVDKGNCEKRTYEIDPDFAEFIAKFLEHYEAISPAYAEGQKELGKSYLTMSREAGYDD